MNALQHQLAALRAPTRSPATGFASPGGGGMVAGGGGGGLSSGGLGGGMGGGRGWKAESASGDTPPRPAPSFAWAEPAKAQLSPMRVAAGAGGVGSPSGGATGLAGGPSLGDASTAAPSSGGGADEDDDAGDGGTGGLARGHRPTNRDLAQREVEHADLEKQLQHIQVRRSAPYRAACRCTCVVHAHTPSPSRPPPRPTLARSPGRVCRANTPSSWLPSCRCAWASLASPARSVPVAHPAAHPVTQRLPSPSHPPANGPTLQLLGGATTVADAAEAQSVLTRLCAKCATIVDEIRKAIAMGDPDAHAGDWGTMQAEEVSPAPPPSLTPSPFLHIPPPPRGSWRTRWRRPSAFPRAHQTSAP
jgi:hypothetical protein